MVFAGSLFAAVGAAMLVTAPAEAGCIKGAIVGGVVGHFAGHHGLLGAGAGCAIGHHEAAKHRRAMEQQRAYERGYNHGRTSPN
jgi:hypothetical protein